MNVIIDQLTNDLEKLIPNEEKEKEELLNGFKKYLNIAVEYIKNSGEKAVNNVDDLINKILKMRADMIFQMNILEMKQYLIEDQALLKLQEKSYEIYETAAKKLLGENNLKEYNTDLEIKKMEDLEKDIRDFNQERVKELISETVLDLCFLDGTNAGLFSLRLFHLKNDLEKKIKEEQQ